MAHVIADRVLETSTTTGAGALTLGGAVTGFQAFSAVCADADTANYSIWGVDGTGGPTGEWETGVGTWGTGGVLTRTTPQASSNAGAAVAFSAGTKRVAITVTAAMLPAGTIVGTTDAQALTNKTIAGGSNTITGLSLTTAVTGVLPAGNGGTGQSSYAVGDLVYAATTTTLGKRAAVATGSVLLSAGLNTAPTWGKVALASAVSGTLPVANGGTGATTLTGILKGNGTGAFTAVTAPSGAIVGTTDMQTLTNKTLTVPILSGFLMSATAGALSYSSGKLYFGDGALQEVAAVDLAQTLTNKTISGASNTITNVSLTAGVTGTLPAANGGTGVTAPGTSGNLLTSNGSAWVSQAPAVAGDCVLLATATLSSTSSIIFDNVYLNSNYIAFRVMFCNVIPSTANASLDLQTSTNNGTSFDSSSAYTYRYQHISGASTVSSYSESNVGVARLTPSLSTEEISGELCLYNLSNTTSEKAFVGQFNAFIYSGGIAHISSVSKRNSVNDIDAIKFVMSTGTFSSGVVKLYGYKA